jgi:hypothetical protein
MSSNCKKKKKKKKWTIPETLKKEKRRRNLIIVNQSERTKKTTVKSLCQYISSLGGARGRNSSMAKKQWRAVYLPSPWLTQNGPLFPS